MPSSLQIKSRERVRQLAEVYTADREINSMLDLVGVAAFNIDYKWLEPACGNGNFLVKILERKLISVCSRARRQDEFEFYTLIALASIYAIDIDQENIAEARLRLEALILAIYSDRQNTKKMKPGFKRSLGYILMHTVLVGDSINGADRIFFTEFGSPKPLYFQERVYRFSDIIAANKTPNSVRLLRPIETYRPCHYTRLGLRHDQ